MSDLVALRPVAQDDLPWLARRRNDPGERGPHEWHGFGSTQHLAGQWAESGMLGSDGGRLIVLAGSDRVGDVMWRPVKTGPISFCWAIGIGLVPESRGHGYGSAAQRLLARYLFAYTHVNRIEASTEITNIGEQRALEKAGFTREGVLRGATYRLGEWRDQVLYSVLRGEVELGAGVPESDAGS